LWLCACATVSPRETFSNVHDLTQARAGQNLMWVQAGDSDSAIQTRLQTLLASELSAEAATEVGLLNSPRLRGRLEELGVAQADLVQAGLLTNPTLNFSLLFPVSPGGVLAIGGSLVQDFLDLALMSVRKKAASAERRRAELEVANDVLGLVADVQTAYFTAVAARELLEVRRTIAQAARAAAELADRQYRAGDTNALNLSTQRVFALEAETAVLRTEADVAAATSHLLELLGDPQTPRPIELPRVLPKVVEAAPLMDGAMERLGIEQRLDLQAACQESAAIEAELELAGASRWTGNFNLGIEAGRDTEGHTAVGPTLGVQVPLFDQGQARIARLEALKRKADAHAEEVRVRVRTQIRAANARLSSTQRLASQLGSMLVPLREQIVQLSQRHYDAMQLGVYQLLLAKQAEVAAYGDYIESTRDYWVARAELARAVGGRLPVVAAAANSKERR
jgi:cobalt-zinc-cadmium efflux system outer membrane protein